MITEYNVRVIRAFPPYTRQRVLKVPSEINEARVQRLINMGFLERVPVRKKRAKKQT